MNKKANIVWLMVVLLRIHATAQISPPGLDDTNVAVWSAVAIRQKLSPHWELTAYVGSSRQSDPDNLAVFKKQAICVINEETTVRINQKFSLSLCASYRIQNRYNTAYPYGSSDPEVKNEERYYFRFYLYEDIGKTKLTLSFRPELRLYSSVNHHAWSPIDEELRFRVKVQASVPLRKSSNQFIVANEVLSTTDHTKGLTSDHWTSYSLTEDRLSTFFRHSFGHVITDVGVMHQIKFDGKYIPHLSFDVILKNPFAKDKV